ncbi:uncharacterized protein LOC108667230 [Hyalella azteca]|uniref:Uncharacterized protein LOC108667230 n=1 Tax=Hyalella azteca TaxID=294128 RepID=A0A8B7N8V6_HYAAZ|nr:uncharacterized protein LOC108667230 [Hyalella azteca]
MLDLLNGVSFYDFSFYFGIFLLAATILIAAWRSTYVPGIQNITVVVLQHASGRQTVERFTSTVRSSATEQEVGLQEELYEEIFLTADDDDEDDGEEDDENEENSGIEEAALSEDVFERFSYESTNSVLDTPERPVAPNTAMSAANMSSESLSGEHNQGVEDLKSVPEVSTSETQSDGTSIPSSDNSAHSDCSEDISSVGGTSKSPACDTDFGEGPSISTSAPTKNVGNENVQPSLNVDNNINGISSHMPENVPAKLPDSPSSLVENFTEDTSVTSTDKTSNPEVDCPPGSIRIRLKYLDDRQRTVFDKPTQNLIGFKRAHFNAELAEHRVIRVIFNGRLLKPDSSTLQECGLFDNCIVHCHVSQPKPPPPAQPQQASGTNSTERLNRVARRRWLHFLWHASVPDALHDDDATQSLDLSNYMSALLWLVVAVLWFMRFKHNYLFSTFSTFVLIFLTMLLVVPHYIFSVDVQLSANLDGNAMRHLGIDRVVVLERLRGRRESAARTRRGEDEQASGEPRPPNSSSVTSDTDRLLASASSPISSGASISLQSRGRDESGSTLAPSNVSSESNLPTACTSSTASGSSVVKNDENSSLSETSSSSSKSIITTEVDSRDFT